MKLRVILGVMLLLLSTGGEAVKTVTADGQTVCSNYASVATSGNNIIISKCVAGTNGVSSDSYKVTPIAVTSSEAGTSFEFSVVRQRGSSGGQTKTVTPKLYLGASVVTGSHIAPSTVTFTPTSSNVQKIVVTFPGTGVYSVIPE